VPNTVKPHHFCIKKMDITFELSVIEILQCFILMFTGFEGNCASLHLCVSGWVSGDVGGGWSPAESLACHAKNYLLHQSSIGKYY
jgi:hypothetical protein